MDEECGCQGMGHRHMDSCGGGGHMHEHGFGYRRRFYSKAEKVEWLRGYAEQLKKELSGVEEKIKALESSLNE
jgi:hypothetical protein